MTPIRARRGKYTHVTHDLRVTICGKRCIAWICGTENWEHVTPREKCPQCELASTTN